MTRLVASAFLSIFLTASAAAAEITVLAAASLTDVMQELARDHETKSSDKVTLSFAGSSTLARQIRSGVPADVFISADERQIDELIKRDLITARSRTPIVSNQLAIVVPFTDRAKFTDIAALKNVRFETIAIANPDSVPAGIYAKRLLVKKGVWSAIVDRVVPTESVRGALAAVQTGNADAAIVYRTDALTARSARLASVIPHSETPEILYVGGVLTKSGKQPAAGRFLTYLQSAAATAILKKHGFLTLH